jgi:hypothetical protein
MLAELVNSPGSVEAQETVRDGVDFSSRETATISRLHLGVLGNGSHVVQGGPKLTNVRRGVVDFHFRTP